MNADSQKPAIQRLKLIQSDYEVKKSTVNKLDEQQTRKENLAKFTSGQLYGQDAKMAERDMIFDLHKDTDYQGDIINEIGNDIKETNSNLKEAGVAVKQQGEEIERIHVGVNEATGTVKKTDLRMNEMNRRTYCSKVLLNILVLLLFIIDVGFLVYKLMKKTSK